MPVFFVATAPRSLTLESPRTRQRKPLLRMYAKSLFLLNLPTVVLAMSVFYALRFALAVSRERTLALAQKQNLCRAFLLKACFAQLNDSKIIPYFLSHYQRCRAIDSCDTFFENQDYCRT